MMRAKTFCALTVLAAILATTPAVAQMGTRRTVRDDVLPLFDLYFQTYLFVANDRDFDRTEPVYSENGQSVGYALTTIRPGMTWVPVDQVTIRYQLEVGDNIWSRNDLDDTDPLAPETALVRHKEVWAEVRSPKETVGIRTGYQYFFDPTHLVLDRYMGAGVFFVNVGESDTINVAAGQVPDGVYEGFSATGDDERRSSNNFENDDYVFAAWSSHEVRDWVLQPGAFMRWDKSEINRPLWYLAPVFHAQGCAGYGSLCFDLDAAGQWGKHERAGLDNRDVDLLAAAVQAGLAINWWPVGWDWRVLAFTADDGDKFDQYETGFRFSGWSKSRTMILSLNELHDQYNNVDESVAAQGAGLFLADQELSYSVIEGLRVFAIAGAGMTLDDTHTGGESYLGAEGHLGVEWSVYDDLASFQLVGGGLLPGKAAAMLKNEIDREATDAMGAVQASMEVSF